MSETQTKEAVETVVEKEENVALEDEATFPDNRIIVYTKNMCQACKQTKRTLDNLGYEYTEINIEENDEARETLLSEGFMSMPVVKLVTGESWSGMKLDKIRAIPEEYKTEKAA